MPLDINLSRETKNMGNSQKTNCSQTEDVNIRQIDEALVGIVRSMEFLIKNAKKANLKSIYRILSIAREDIILWAANYDRILPETERHKQELLFDTGLLIALDYISKYASTDNLELKKEMRDNLELLKQSGINISSKTF